MFDRYRESSWRANVVRITTHLFRSVDVHAMDRSDDSTPHDSTVTIPERAQESRFKLWLLLSVNRWVLAGGLAASVFASLVVLGESAPVRRGNSWKLP